MSPHTQSSWCGGRGWLAVLKRLHYCVGDVLHSSFWECWDWCVLSDEQIQWRVHTWTNEGAVTADQRRCCLGLFKPSYDQRVFSLVRGLTPTCPNIMSLASKQRHTWAVVLNWLSDCRTLLELPHRVTFNPCLKSMSMQTPTMFTALHTFVMMFTTKLSGRLGLKGCGSWPQIANALFWLPSRLMASWIHVRHFLFNYEGHDPNRRCAQAYRLCKRVIIICCHKK